MLRFFKHLLSELIVHVHVQTVASGFGGVFFSGWTRKKPPEGLIGLYVHVFIILIKWYITKNSGGTLPSPRRI